MVDGVKVKSGTGPNPNPKPNRGSTSAVAPTTTGNRQTVDTSVNGGHHFKPEADVSFEARGNRGPRYTDTAPTTSPTTHMAQPTSSGGPLKGEPDWHGGEADDESDYEEDEEYEGEEGSRVTRGIRSSGNQWKWNMKAVGSGKRDWGDITLEERGSLLSLSSVRVTDAGTYTCHRRGREQFSVKVAVAGESQHQ